VQELESRLAKALDLAKRYKEKLDSVEKIKLEQTDHHNREIKDLMDKIQEIEEKLDETNEFFFWLIDENQDALEKVRKAGQEAQKVSMKYEGCII
jgi:Zn-dependent M16 (insulinase) family peptidase